MHIYTRGDTHTYIKFNKSTEIISALRISGKNKTSEFYLQVFYWTSLS